jgi:hypothetical protein
MGVASQIEMSPPLRSLRSLRSHVKVIRENILSPHQNWAKSACFWGRRPPKIEFGTPDLEKGSSWDFFPIFRFFKPLTIKIGQKL